MHREGPAKQISTYMEKLAINFLPLLHKGGTGTYAHLLLDQFSRLSPEQLDSFFFIFPEGCSLPEIFNNSLNTIVLPVMNRRKKVIAEQIAIPSLLKSRKISWLHQLAFSIPYRNKNFQVISTIHDLTFHLFPETIPFYKRMYYSHNFTRSIRQSSHIITDSQTVKDQILDHYSIPPEKIMVVPLGVSTGWGDIPFHKQQIETLEKLSIQSKKYFLHVGTLEPRKNIETLLEWWERWKERNNDGTVLVLVGDKGWRYRHLMNKIQKTRDVCYLGKVSQRTLQTLYLNTMALVNLSMYEGFGLPLVEAAYFNIPLILSRIPVFEEIRGHSDLLVDDYESFSHLLDECKNKTNDYVELIKTSRWIKQRYNFDTSFDKLFDWYSECILKK